ncbi:unnamed protein product [Notodromas monacha]|uniref:Uncharacterized protein n=1 Tax=Notodromas monacha TaxID=399045 RepID=A0A7R9GB84_9CRUS|nr:unnamed protein product [Notodromas monacha]CAG0914544.1 unnamed protein product [Notodromas monacha]
MADDEQTKKEKDVEKRDFDDDEASSSPGPEGDKDQKEKIPYPYVAIGSIFAFSITEVLSNRALGTVSHTYFVTELQLEPGFVTRFSQARRPFFIMLSFVWAYISESWTGRYPILAYIGMHIFAIFGIAEGSCKTAFSAEQFKLPEQEVEKDNYFYWNYTVMNVAVFAMSIVAPMMRNIPCFGREDCYSIVLGFAGVTAAIVAVIFIAASPWFYKAPPVGNVTGRALSCLFFGVKNCLTHRRNPDYTHWMDYAQDSGHSKEMVDVIKHLLNVMVLLLPLSVYDSIYGLHADELQWYNPLLTFVMVPTAIKIIFPWMRRKRILPRYLHKVMFGFVLMIITYLFVDVIAYLVETRNPMPRLSSSQSAVQLLGGIEGQSVDVYLTGPGVPSLKKTVPPGGMATWDTLEHGKTYVLSSQPSGVPALASVTADGGSAFTGIVWGSAAAAPSVKMFPEPDAYGVNLTNRPMIRAVALSPDAGKKVELSRKDKEVKVLKLPAGGVGASEYLQKIPVGTYEIKVDGKPAGKEWFDAGGVYLILLSGGDEPARVTTQVKPAEVHLLWMLIPLFILTVSEVLTFPTITIFYINEVPANMMGVSLSLISQSNHPMNFLSAAVTDTFIPYLWQEFLFYTILLTLDTILLGFLSKWYLAKETAAENAAASRDEPKDSEERGSLTRASRLTGFDTSLRSRSSYRKSIAAHEATKQLTNADLGPSSAVPKTA